MCVSECVGFGGGQIEHEIRVHARFLALVGSRDAVMFLSQNMEQLAAFQEKELSDRYDYLLAQIMNRKP